MITAQNYFTEINQINLETAPEAIRNGHSLFSRATSNGQNMTAYSSNATISKVVDLYLQKLNAWIEATQNKKTEPEPAEPKPTPEPKPAPAPKPPKAPKTKPEPKPKPAPKPKPEPKPQKAKAPDPEPEPQPAKHQVDKIPFAVAFINRYRKMQGKMIPLRLRKGQRGLSINALLASLQKNMIEKVVTKTDKYADELYAIQKKLTRLLKNNKGYVKVKVELDDYPNYLEIVNSYAIKSITALAKRFIAIQGKEDVKPDAEKLLKAIDKNMEAGTVTKSETADMHEALSHYIAGKTTSIEVSEQTLNGLHGLAGTPKKPELKGYAKDISEATGVTNRNDLDEIENYMRDVLFHSTLNWQSKKQFDAGARTAWKDIQWMRSPAGKAHIAKLMKEFSGDLAGVNRSVYKKRHAKAKKQRRPKSKKALAGVNAPAHEPEVTETFVEIIEPPVPPKPKVDAKNLPDIISSEQLRELEFDKMGFTGKWLKLVGDPVFPFSMMIHAKPGMGKSSLAIEFCHYLATEHDKKILYISKDEGNSSYTMQEKFERLNAFHHNVHLSNGKIPDAAKLQQYDFVVFDLMNDFDFDYKDFKFDYIEKYKKHTTPKKIGFISVFKATADGQFRGNKDWENMFDVSISINDEGFAQAGKNRFGAFGVLKYLQSSSEKVYKVSSLIEAEKYRNRVLTKDKIELVIVDGPDGRFWLVSPQYASVLAEQGFNVHSNSIMAATQALNGVDEPRGIRTNLPEAITSIAQARQFLTELDSNDESYDPTLDAHDLQGQPFTHQESEQLNKLMTDIANLPGNFDAYDFVASLSE